MTNWPGALIKHWPVSANSLIRSDIGALPRNSLGESVGGYFMRSGSEKRAGRDSPKTAFFCNDKLPSNDLRVCTAFLSF